VYSYSGYLTRTKCIACGVKIKKIQNNESGGSPRRVGVIEMKFTQSPKRTNATTTTNLDPAGQPEPDDEAPATIVHHSAEVWIGNRFDDRRVPSTTYGHDPMHARRTIVAIERCPENAGDHR